MFLRLWTRAPRTSIASSFIALVTGGVHGEEFVLSGKRV